MRVPSFFVALTVAAFGLKAPVWAGSSSISWPGWNINSTENLSEIYDESKPSPHLLSALFDANPRTTWIVNPRAGLEAMSNGKSGEKFFQKTRRGLMISGRSRWVSGLQIMNGDNNSRRAFAAGNRIRTLRITILSGEKRHAYTIPLRDRMGWQRVSWPRQKSDAIAIEFTGVLKAGQPVSSSGLGLLDGTREIRWNMPQLVVFWDGTDGDNSSRLLDNGGRYVDGVAVDGGYSDEWSNDGRFVAGLNGGGGTKTPYLWVADARRGRIIRKISAPALDSEANYRWISPHQLRVKWSLFSRTGNLKLL